MKKCNLIYTIIFSSGLLLLQSCASTQPITIEARQPGSIDFPENTKKVVVIDNAGKLIDAEDPSVYTMYSEDVINLSKNKEVYARALSQFLGDENYFSEVLLFPKALREDIDYGMTSVLEKDDGKKYLEETNADALISINNFLFLTDNIDVVDQYDGFPLRVNKNLVSALLRVYDKSGRPISPHMLVSDSILSIAKNDSIAELNLVLGLADKSTKLLIPFWQTQERWIYTDATKYMKEANKLASENKWAEAANVWEENIDKPSVDYKKARIACNIALANENMGNIDGALVWVNKALGYFGEKQSGDDYTRLKWYKNQLEQRTETMSRLQKQLNVVN